MGRFWCDLMDFSQLMGVTKTQKDERLSMPSQSGQMTPSPSPKIHDAHCFELDDEQFKIAPQTPKQLQQIMKMENITVRDTHKRTSSTTTQNASHEVLESTPVELEEEEEFELAFTSISNSPSRMVLQVPVNFDTTNREDDMASSTSAPSLSPVTVGSSDPFRKDTFSLFSGDDDGNDNDNGDDNSAGTFSFGSRMLNANMSPEEYETMMEEEQEFREKKSDEILNCLNGTVVHRKRSQKHRGRKFQFKSGSDNDTDTVGSGSLEEDEKVVDLWHLRQLALSRGGLLDASTRKRAWLKLVDANEHILASSMGLPSENSAHKATAGSESAHVTKLSDDEISLIQQDITTCIWNIEAGIEQTRKSRTLQKRLRYQARMKAQAADDASATPSVTSFKSGMSGSTAGGRITPQLIPESIRAFPRNNNNSCSKAEADQGTVASSPLHLASPEASTTSGTYSMPSVSPVGVLHPQRRRERSSREEQSLLLNIITSVLRAMPEGSDADRDDGSTQRLHYFQGMHNVAAPILISLESPSLTSLVLKRLAMHHLRDAMAPTFMNVQAGIRAMFMPLLKEVDASLHDLLVANNIIDPCTYALPWILCWFANDIARYEIISRLFDVFLASHASCPIYISVALITSPINRTRIENTLRGEMEVKSALYNLPNTMIKGLSSMEASRIFEDIIQVALSYMKSYPPEKVFAAAKEYPSDLVASSVYIIDSTALANKPPRWTYKSSAQTDWALIREAKKMRDLSPISRMARQKGREEKFASFDRESSSTASFQYNMALDASGLEMCAKSAIRNKNRRNSTSRKYINAFLLTLLATILFSTCFTNFNLDEKHHVKMNVNTTTLPEAVPIVDTSCEYGMYHSIPFIPSRGKEWTVADEPILPSLNNIVKKDEASNEKSHAQVAVVDEAILPSAHNIVKKDEASNEKSHAQVAVVDEAILPSVHYIVKKDEASNEKSHAQVAQSDTSDIFVEEAVEPTTIELLADLEAEESEEISEVEIMFVELPERGAYGNTEPDEEFGQNKVAKVVSALQNKVEKLITMVKKVKEYAINNPDLFFIMQ